MAFYGPACGSTSPSARLNEIPQSSPSTLGCVDKPSPPFSPLTGLSVYNAPEHVDEVGQFWEVMAVVWLKYWGKIEDDRRKSDEIHPPWRPIDWQSGMRSEKESPIFPAS
ncbi:hypothetical protein K443DRAFT_9843 [Laccaria amethystina LaAM-08-1]|uniref:Uncharacterized protein n=1 Tax=Laccaria amethystina LaAM-08-1 TaxID=1095629 RepID=A0A0C9WXQ0_9AGAR|nr:hypothetical protein K443DRAFT_9843 [Laccaria amethystina LaAM-08-1]